jgi:hypothetical protein
MTTKTTVAVLAISLVLASCQAVAQTTPAIEPEIARVVADISATEAESAKYSGGLVKALIESRLSTLRQTKAMLEQRRAASTFNISVRYTIDGRPFTVPTTATNDVAAIERELAATRTKIESAQAEAARYSGGLVLAMKHSTIATLQQTEAMLDQRRVALTFGLPQYIGFAGQPASSPSAGSGHPAPPVQDTARTWEIVEVNSRVTESNSTWWKYAWKVTVRNGGSQPIAVRATVEFQDAQGFIVDTDDSETTRVGAGETVTMTGYDLVTAAVADNIAKTNAKVRQVQ